MVVRSYQEKLEESRMLGASESTVDVYEYEVRSEKPVPINQPYTWYIGRRGDL
jgi:hypothetical protein